MNFKNQQKFANFMNLKKILTTFILLFSLSIVLKVTQSLIWQNFNF